MDKESGGYTSNSWTSYKRTSATAYAVDGTGTTQSKVDYRHSVGNSTPDYYRKLKSGSLLPMTSFSQFEVKGEILDTSYETNRDSYSSWPEPHWWSYDKRNWASIAWSFVESDLSSVSIPDANYLVQAAAANIYSSGWDALTFALELSKTVDMFRNFLSKYGPVLREVNAKQLADAYLEARYGWRTLIYDLKDIMKAINSVDDGRKRYKEVCHDMDFDSNVQSSVSLGNWSSCIPTCKIETNYTISTRGTVMADITPPKIQLNVPITAWEVTRLSFVVDWIVNVGQFLEAMSFLALSAKYVAATGVLVIGNRTVTANPVTWKAGYHGGYINWSSSCTASWTIRTPTSVPTIPLIRLRLDALKVADLAALTVQRIRR